ncbi:hypothetical protein [Alishewanella sp. HL-SH05]|uniref:hypothetical protein n=1 Tax=Alishewanella sp. HL-SH05 TaxID=3461145 RepID=UPI004041E4E1
MSFIHTILLYSHIFLGALCLVLFWVPVICGKGTKLHKLSGRYYYFMMVFIAGSGIVMSLMVLFDPAQVYLKGAILPAEKLAKFVSERRHFSAFLLLLSVLTWVTVRHAYVVLKVQADRQPLRTWHYLLPVVSLMLGSLFMLGYGFNTGTWLFMIFAMVGVFTSTGIVRYAFRAELANRQWIIEHFSSMIGSGIALYTAFFAAGGRKLLSELLSREWQLATWLIAPIVGTLAISLLTKHFSRKFRVSPSTK